MKKFITTVLLALVVSASSYAFDIKDLFGGKETTETESTSGSDNGSSGILGAIGSFVNSVTANSNFSVDDLVGTWNYTSPAVTFDSENALKNVGGAAAATAVESKLEPYYTRLGFDKTSLVVDADHNFTLKMGLLTLKGTIEKDDEGMVFSFSAFGKVSLGQVRANATKSGSTLNLTFDATKMVQLLTKVSSVLNSTAINTLTTLLNSYDGIYMGFKLKKA